MRYPSEIAGKYSAENKGGRTMQQIKIKSGLPDVRLLGRLDPGQDPIALDWTGTGLEIQFAGSNLWAELEAPVQTPVMWMIVLADGYPVTRFPVEPGCRFYPLLLGMEPEKDRTVTLLKETQCMPFAPEATVLIRSLRLDGRLLRLHPYDRRIEFIGDSLTSAEGSLAPPGNDEWITPWFSARANYSWYACRELNAECRILSQSGYGVCWNWEHAEEGNMTDGYEKIVGVLSGEAAERRGCGKTYDFSSWQPDIVCIRLLSNDAGGIKAKGSPEKDFETVISGCLALIRKVRKNNPVSSIVWILPGTDCFPEIGREAVCRAAAEGIDRITFFTLPDYTEADFGARAHPNAEWNRKAGLLLAEYLKTLL